MSFTATFEVNTFKQIVAVLKSLFNEVNIIFGKDVVTMTLLDAARSGAIHADLVPLIYENEGGDMNVFGVNLTTLYTFVRSGKKNDLLTFRSSSDNEILHASITSADVDNSDVKECRFKMSIIPVVHVQIPYESYSYEVIITHDYLYNVINALTSFSSTLKINIDKILEFESGASSIDNSKFRLSKNVFLIKSNMVKQSFVYEIKFIDKFLKKRICKEIRIGFMEDGTMGLHYNWDIHNNFVLLLSPI